MTALLALLLALPARAQEVSTPTVQTSTPIVGEITIKRLDVFDTSVKGEDLWIFKAANKIHAVTREDVVRREILLEPGDKWDPMKALESERNLRANGFFRLVEIATRPAPGGKLDLAVKTQDSWTTMAQFSVGTEGGDHFFIYGLQEANLLGYNKSIGFLHAQVGSEIRNIFSYNDPRVLTTRFRLSSMYTTTRTGESKGADLRRPFFSLETPYALASGAFRFVREEPNYVDSEERSHYVADRKFAYGSAGLRLPFDAPFVQRPELGWYAEKHVFSRADDTLFLPPNRSVSGPTLGYAWIVPDYVKETYINKMERVEDFNLGNELRVLTGFMGRTLGSDRDRLLFNVSDQQGVDLGPGRFLLGQVGYAGRLAHEHVENGMLFTDLNLFWKTEGPWLPQTWVAHTEFNSGKNLDVENQVMLGGNNGLRGYRNYSFTGAKSLLFNLENRLFLPREYFHLFRLGYAVFFDAGSVVPEGSGFSFLRFRSDVGFGLRFASTRSTGGRVFRMDVAYALNRGPGGSRLVFAARSGQAFDIFSSSIRKVRLSPNSRLETFPQEQSPLR
jgi:hypothetical protein